MRQKARARGTVANGNAADRQKSHVAIASHTAFQAACASVANAAAASTVLTPTEILSQLNALKDLKDAGFYNQDELDAEVAKLKGQTQPKPTKAPGERKGKRAAANDCDE